MVKENNSRCNLRNGNDKKHYMKWKNQENRALNGNVMYNFKCYL